ncbi:MAG: pyruvate-ferredoxin/flavodoxin oxidoreductase [Verrucomicrobiales bacterium]|jgi:pyruvate-ferredoxin/flavodoxin oxidoreductase
MRLDPIAPVGEISILPTSGCFIPNVSHLPKSEKQEERTPVVKMEKFDSEYRAGLGYHQPAGALASVGVMAAGSGQTQSKYVARRETPKYIAENCTQCMECITACPDTALPNTAQDISTVLQTAIRNYISGKEDREQLLAAIPDIEANAREKMNAAIAAKESVPFKDIVQTEVEALNGKISAKAKKEFAGIMEVVPMAYTKVPAIFKSVEKKAPGQGGLFSIFVSDLCKGCGECVVECGDHNALVMVPDTEELNYEITSAQIFSRMLPDTSQKYLGLYDDESPQDSRPAALRNHLMVRRNYEALVSGDGACAGCGEKSILRAVASITEAYMRPMYHKKADRLMEKADKLEKDGVAKLAALKSSDEEAYNLYKRTVAHAVMGLGGEDEKDTTTRIEANGPISDEDIISTLVSVMRVDAFNHKELQAVDGRLANGQSVMFMGASTGCNTVYGSTPPSNPHPYPWMNSLFQDGATISWLLSESLTMKHGRRSVVPERIATRLLEREENVITDALYFDYTHMTDNHMTDQEINELPKVWIVGGDGALGDIGFQNISKVMLQNRPNVKAIMLDTQVYSNTGGQNSDSSTMLGGYDMNQFGTASQGKLHEKKSVAEAFTSGHGSPYVGQVSMANSAKLYQTILEGLQYRGTAFFQCFTTCQPEYGVADNMSAQQAKLIRDSRGMPEFVYNPRKGELATECFDLKGNPSITRDWWDGAAYSDKSKYTYTVAHWATTEARFRKHLKKITEAEAADLIHFDDMLIRLNQDDVIYRRVFDPEHRSFVPDFAVYIKAEINGKMTWLTVSRQMVLFAVERRKCWRMLQSRAGIVNLDYQAQKSLLAKVDMGDISVEDLRTKTRELVDAELAAIDPKAKK